MRIIAVAPTFADAIVGAMDPKLATGLLGKRFSGLDGSSLGSMDRSGPLVAGSDVRPSAVGTMSNVVVFRHGLRLSTFRGFASKRICLTTPSGICCSWRFRTLNNPREDAPETEARRTGVGRSGALEGSAFLGRDLYRLPKEVNTVIGRRVPEAGASSRNQSDDQEELPCESAERWNVGG